MWKKGHELKSVNNDLYLGHIILKNITDKQESCK